MRLFVASTSVAWDVFIVSCVENFHCFLRDDTVSCPAKHERWKRLEIVGYNLEPVDESEIQEVFKAGSL